MFRRGQKMQLICCVVLLTMGAIYFLMPPSNEVFMSLSYSFDYYLNLSIVTCYWLWSESVNFSAFDCQSESIDDIKNVIIVREQVKWLLVAYDWQNWTKNDKINRTMLRLWQKEVNYQVKYYVYRWTQGTKMCKELWGELMIRWEKR